MTTGAIGIFPSVSALLFVAGSALAQTAQPYPAAPPPTYAPPPPPVYVAPPIASDPTVRNHDGFYLRLGLGGGTLKTAGALPPPLPVSPLLTPLRHPVA